MTKFQVNKYYKYTGNKNQLEEMIKPEHIYKCVSMDKCDESYFCKFEDIFGNLTVNTYYSDAHLSLFTLIDMEEENWEKDRENISERLSSFIKKDKVSHPPHYNQGGIEVIDQMIVLFGLEKVIAFCELNAYKYRMRAGYKDNIEQDINKALWYENKTKELEKKLSID